MIKNKRVVSAEDFFGKLLPYLEHPRMDIVADMRRCVEEGKDYIHIFRDVEFKVLRGDADQYLRAKEPDVQDFFAPQADETAEIIPPQPEPKKEFEDRAIAAKHPRPKPAMPPDLKSRDV